MNAAGAGTELASALAREVRPALLARWLNAYAASTLRLPGPVDREVLGRLLSPLLDSLAESLAGEPDLPAPGSSALRETERSLAFIASQLAATGSSGFDVSALVVALRDCIVDRSAEATRPALCRLFDWLAALAGDSFATARGEAARERHREILERGTPVVLVAAELPAVFLLGAPDAALADGVLGRLLMLIIRVGARTAVIDASGLEQPAAAPLLESLVRFARHRKLVGAVEIVAVGLRDDEAEAWRGAVGPDGAVLHVVERFDDAVRYGLARAGVQVVRRPG